MATYQKVIQLKSSDKEDAEFVSYTVKRRIANEKIRHAMEKVKDVYNRMEEELIQAKKERTLARNNLVHAIYGVQVGELPEEKDIADVLKNISRSSISNADGGLKKVKYHENSDSPTCGEAGKNGPGFTLINDFYCLCVGRENAKAVCHKDIAGPCCCCCEKCTKGCQCDKNCDCKSCNCGAGCKACPNHNKWLRLFNVEKKELVDLPHGWPHIRRVCNLTSTEAVNTTAESIQEVLDDFNKLLGKNSSEKAIDLKGANVESRRLFVLGFAKDMQGDPHGCNGNGDGVCVNYWAVSNVGMGIVWQNYMLEAQKHLQEMEKHIKKAHQLSTMIQKLKESAEESYRKSGHGRLPSGLAKNENEGESELFCQLRLLAENDPEKLVFENEEREKQIMRHIEKVGPEIRSLAGEAHTREFSHIAKFHTIAPKAKKLMGTIRDKRRKAVEKRLSAKRHLHQVIFGEYGGEAEDTGELGPTKETIQKIFSGTTFQESCGGSGIKMTGKSLINDFICLCARRIDRADDDGICKSKVDTTVDKDFKNWTAVWHWNNHRICVNTPPLIPTPQNIHKLVALFERAVNRQQDKSQVKGVFGFVNTEHNKEGECNTTHVGSTCVNYNYTLKNGGIEWVNHLKNASKDLEDMARYAEESESTLPELELLEYNALLLYEEAKYSTHLPHVTPPNETIANSSNESYQGDSTNASQEGELEEEEGEENKDTTWKGRPPWRKMKMLMKFALVVLVFGVGYCAEHPSEEEFKLFCRILEEAERMLADVKDYVYDESKDKEILREMQVLFNATTDNMKEFRKMLWSTKDFFEAHPPPTDAKNRREAHLEIGQLITKGERKIQESREIAVKVNEKMEEAKLSVLRGLYGDGVKKVPKIRENWTAIQNDNMSIFNSVLSAKESCGHEKETGKTLFNDLFCLCVGDATDAAGPCSAYLLSPKKDGGGTKGSWTQMKYFSGNCPALSLAGSIEKIMGECSKNKEENSMKKGMSELLKEFEEMIGKGEAKETAKKKIFGHSGRKNKEEVKTCTGAGRGGDANICVDYKHNYNDDKKSYNITWHEKFKNYTTLMKSAKDLEDQILKNRADLLLLKSQAWVAYSREKDDETSNLDDMNEGITWERRAMTEKKAEKREYIDVSEETTQPSQLSQPVRGQGAPGNPPHYILISSTETSQPSPKKTDEGKGGRREEPEVTVISSESTTQEAPSPSQGPSQATSQPPTQSAKRLREEKKTGE